MREFELRFPFEETPDQEEVIRSVKEDMETKLPMDRLVCGDVGFGKTENKLILIDKNYHQEIQLVMKIEKILSFLKTVCLKF